MTREEMLAKLHKLPFCVFWPWSWEDVGFTERPMWANSKGYGYYFCDEPCQFAKIENVPYEILEDINKIMDMWDKYDWKEEDVEKIISPMIKALSFEKIFDELCIRDYDHECQMDFITSVSNANAKTLYCGVSYDKYEIFETERELIDCFTKDDIDESWDYMEDELLEAWIDRLYGDNLNFIWPFDKV